jgi:hypothetical protein
MILQSMVSTVNRGSAIIPINTVNLVNPVNTATGADTSAR